MYLEELIGKIIFVDGEKYRGAYLKTETYAAGSKPDKVLVLRHWESPVDSKERQAKNGPAESPRTASWALDGRFYLWSVINALTGLQRLGNGMIAGICKWFDSERGYGFIVSDEVAGDVFVHHSMIEGDGYKVLVEGEKVELTIDQEHPKLRASKVKRLAWADSEAKAVASDRQQPLTEHLDHEKTLRIR